MTSTRHNSRATASLLATTLALASVALPASAVERLALVVGNADYTEAPLRNPVNDARAVAATLEGLGFEVIRLENATKQQMERAVIRFTSRLEEGTAGLFYYAGHGIQVRGRNYLVPVGTRFQTQREARIESVPVDLVLDELGYAGNRLNIVILDACRNNPFERRLRGMSRGLAAIDAARGTLIAYATSPGSVALDGDGSNGLYTEEFLRALARPGLKIEEVFKQVRIGVARRTSSSQVPWESSSLTGDFVFNPVSVDASPAPAARPRHETVFWESAERIGTAAAYRAYLDQYPEGAFATLAALRIAALESSAAATADQRPTLEQRPQAASPSKSTEERRDRPLVAVLPPEGIDFGCTATTFSPGSTIATLQSKLEAAGLSATVFRYLGWYVEAEPDDLWRPTGLRKEPIPERVYEHGRGLEVDAMLLSWYEVVGTGTCRTNYELYMYDVRLETVHEWTATESSLGYVAADLAERFLEKRALAEASSR